MDERLQLLESMVRIRAFENMLSKLFKRGKLPGFVHLYSGQEAVAVGACSVLGPEDRITSTHRGHGHILAKGAEPSRMMAEIFGRVDGYCRGRGGSMHIFDFELGILGANGIVAGGIPLATGAALADVTFDRPHVTVAFFGDGATGQGVLFESMNLSALWNLPIIYMCENNGYAEWMPTDTISATDIADRAASFGMPSVTVDGNDVMAVREAASAAAERARAGKGPSFIQAKTYRHHGHNQGEEAFAGDYRPVEEMESWMQRDPIPLYTARLIEEGLIDAEAVAAMESTALAEMKAAVKFAENSEFPDPSSALDNLYAEVK
ncbi:thiamine pyrophosphate-dependent dehydrogenase E1 component subunit alpha [Aeromicrobium sp. P5_D10]